MWIKYRTSIFLLVSFLLLFSGFWLFPNFAFIFFISLLLQLFLSPLVKLLSKKMSRTAASIVTVLLTIVIIAAGITVVSSSFLPTLRDFVEALPDYTKQLKNLPFISENTYIAQSLDEAWSEIANISITAVTSSIGIILSMFSKLIDIVIILFVTFYLLSDGFMIQTYLVNLFPSNSSSRVGQLFDNILHSLQIYIRSQFIMCAITAVVTFVYFTIMDVKYASVFAVMSGLAELIPVIGPTVASCFGIIFTTAYDSSLLIPTAIFYLIMTQINHNLVYPWLIGKSLKLHPVAIILGIIFGGEILGAAGMFLAVPCIVIFKHLIEDIHQHDKEGLPKNP